MIKNLNEIANNAYICGEIDSEPKFSYEDHGENFYEFTVKIPRLSGRADILPVTVPEGLLTAEMTVGGTICALGQFRSYNKLEGGRSRLMLTVFVKEVLESQPDKTPPNSIVLAGYICKPPVYRITPLNREIADILIAVNREYGKTDYIPAIAWGKNANFVDKLDVGERVVISGRMQSREYQKVTDSGTETRIAYEVSISFLSAVDSEEEMRKTTEEFLNRIKGA